MIKEWILFRISLQSVPETGIVLYHKRTISVISSDPPCKYGNARMYNVKCTKVSLKPANENISLNKQKDGYLIHTWSVKAFKGTVVNQALPSLHGGSLEITLTVPVKNWNRNRLISIFALSKYCFPPVNSKSN